MKSILPNDRAMVKAMLISEDRPVLMRKKVKANYIVNTSTTDGKITVTLPDWFLDGEYKLKVYLYNSTGEINREIFTIFDYLDFGIFANETYEFGPFDLCPSNSRPNPPHEPDGEDEVENWDLYPYTTNTTDIDGDHLYYKWRWDTILDPIYTTWDILNPYQSGENCTQYIGWMFPGTRDISVCAKDHWLSMDPTNWSTPLTVQVSQSDNSMGCSWSNPLLNSFSANTVAVNEQTSSTGFNSEVYIEQGTRDSFSWSWDFGDGNTSYDESVSHSYSQIGNYTVNLTITYQGDMYNVSTSIMVLPLKARFNASSDGAQPDVDIIFNDTSSGLYNFTNFTWDFDDDNVSYEQNVSHSFSSEGEYNVTLTVIDEQNNTNTHYQIIYVETVSPAIVFVDESPHTVGFGSNVTIYADFFDNQSRVNSVSVNITYPDNGSGNFSMGKNLSCPYDFEYVFNDTWQAGLYSYSIWVYDHAGNCNATGLFNFSVSVNATISVCTIKNTYGPSEGQINITDPPTSNIGYELLDDGSVLHIWNKYDSYYFNTNSGIQLTNHYDEYWAHNVLMLGYYNNDVWNLIYRTDELNGFNRDVDSDDETFVNATLWKDLSYGGYDFRLAIRYCLGVDDNELTVIPYIKNIDDEDIPYLLGFGWELQDIQVDMTETGDYIEVGNESYLLNKTLDNSYANISSPIYCWNNTSNETEICGYSDPVFYIMENITETTTESLYLRWDKDLNYKLLVKSRTGQYNAPVTLFIKVGSLNVGQEKYTEMFWYDAEQATYYFDSVDDEERWVTLPGYMVDGNSGTFASTTESEDVELCDDNSYSSGGSGVISKVELRARTYFSSVGGEVDCRVYLRPVFGGSSDGDDHVIYCPSAAAWSSYYDITSDTNAPSSWTWTDIAGLDCDVEAYIGAGGKNPTVYCSKVEVRVTYNHPSGISDPYPADDSINISLQPMLNITVSDDEGDSMTITWLSNSSGSWTAFGSNCSVGNGTYHQIFSNASVNGQWWYWKVNVSDGTVYNESDVFRFYTGVQSKIVNTGSTNISGYLLIQVQFYTLWEPRAWVVDNDTINETTPRTIDSGCQLSLDTIFNGLVSTGDLTHGDGTYRVYAAFRDPDGDVLICNDASKMEAWWEFELDTG